MSETSSTIWTCDRCGRVDQHPLNAQPPNWATLIEVNPPKADPGEGRRLHVCSWCLGAFRSWFKAGKDQPSEEAAK